MRGCEARWRLQRTARSRCVWGSRLSAASRLRTSRPSLLPSPLPRPLLPAEPRQRGSILYARVACTKSHTHGGKSCGCCRGECCLAFLPERRVTLPGSLGRSILLRSPARTQAPGRRKRNQPWLGAAPGGAGSLVWHFACCLSQACGINNQAVTQPRIRRLRCWWMARFLHIYVADCC